MLLLKMAASEKVSFMIFYTIVRGHFDMPLSVRLSVHPFVTLYGIGFV